MKNFRWLEIATWFALICTIVFVFIAVTKIANGQIFDIPPEETSLEVSPLIDKTIIDSDLDIDEVKYSYITDKLYAEKGYDNFTEFSYDVSENVKAIFSSRQFYNNPSDNLWYQVEYATTTIEDWLKNSVSQGNFFEFIKTAYAQVVSLFSSIDGAVAGNTDNTDWATLHDKTNADIISNTTNKAADLCGGIENGTLLGFKEIKRAILSFYTHNVISPSSTITSSTLVLTASGGGKNELTPQQAAELVSKTQTQETLVASDYASSSFDGVSFASSTNFAAVDGTKIPFLLNTSGKNYLQGKITNSTSTTFGIILTGDMTNTPPNFLAGKKTTLSCYNSEEVGTTKDPVLYVQMAVATTTPPVVIATTTITISELLIAQIIFIIDGLFFIFILALVIFTMNKLFNL